MAKNRVDQAQGPAGRERCRGKRGWSRPGEAAGSTGGGSRLGYQHACIAVLCDLLEFVVVRQCGDRSAGLQGAPGERTAHTRRGKNPVLSRVLGEGRGWGGIKPSHAPSSCVPDALHVHSCRKPWSRRPRGAQILRAEGSNGLQEQPQAPPPS